MRSDRRFDPGTRLPSTAYRVNASYCGDTISSMSRDHRQLKMFQLADELVLDVYRQTQSFPPEESCALQSQLRRSAVSVAANMVEGCARESKREYLQFARMALGSASECHYLLRGCSRIRRPRDGAQPRDPARHGPRGDGVASSKGRNNAGRAVGPVPPGRGRRLSPCVVRLGTRSDDYALPPLPSLAPPAPPARGRLIRLHPLKLSSRLGYFGGVETAPIQDEADHVVRSLQRLADGIKRSPEAGSRSPEAG